MKTPLLVKVWGCFLLLLLTNQINYIISLKSNGFLSISITSHLFRWKVNTPYTRLLLVKSYHSNRYSSATFPMKSSVLFPLPDSLLFLSAMGSRFMLHHTANDIYKPSHHTQQCLYLCLFFWYFRLEISPHNGIACLSFRIHLYLLHGQNI